VTSPAADAALETNGAVTALAAKAADCSSVRRVSVAMALPPVQTKLCLSEP